MRTDKREDDENLRVWSGVLHNSGFWPMARTREIRVVRSSEAPREHWGFAMGDEVNAQFLRQGAVDGLHLIDKKQVKV